MGVREPVWHKRARHQKGGTERSGTAERDTREMAQDTYYVDDTRERGTYVRTRERAQTRLARTYVRTDEGRHEAKRGPTSEARVGTCGTY